MSRKGGKLVVIGGGIAGLCAGVYGCRSGYEVEVLEQRDTLGGLATQWRRGDYTFETCLHWLAGSNPDGVLHEAWREVCDIDSLRFVNHGVFVQLETENGHGLTIYTDTDKLEAALLKASPRDGDEIRRFVSAIRHLSDLPMPHSGGSWAEKAGGLMHTVRDMPLLWELSRISCEDYGQRFSHPLLRRFFGDGPTARMMVLALVMSLGWMGRRNAGYPIGGSGTVIGAVAERLTKLGGRVRHNARVEKIEVERGTVTGVRLAGGAFVAADAVISAADGHATLYEMLEGRFVDSTITKAYDTRDVFPSYLQVSLGIARDLSQQPGFLTVVLDEPIEVDNRTAAGSVSFRIFNYDPTFAPAGKTAVTAFLATDNFAYWDQVRRDDPLLYQVEKLRVASAVASVLERRMPGLRRDIEVVDVSTPASVLRHTGNWKGSMEGWLPTPESGISPLPQTLPGLHHFAMAGQWVQPGGGLPSGLLTARSAVLALCHEDHVPFLAREVA